MKRFLKPKEKKNEDLSWESLPIEMQVLILRYCKPQKPKYKLLINFHERAVRNSDRWFDIWIEYEELKLYLITDDISITVYDQDYDMYPGFYAECVHRCVSHDVGSKFRITNRNKFNTKIMKISRRIYRDIKDIMYNNLNDFEMIRNDILYSIYFCILDTWGSGVRDYRKGKKFSILVDLIKRKK